MTSKVLRSLDERFNVTTPCSFASSVRVPAFARASFRPGASPARFAEYIASLGSVAAAAPSTRERVDYYRQLKERLDRLMNRIDGEERKAIVAAVVARIPVPSQAEIRAAQKEAIKADEQFWDLMADMNASSTEGHKLLAASAEAKRKEHERLAADAVERRDIARERLAKLARGETVDGGLGKKLDIAAMMKTAGFTTRSMKRAQATASLTDEEFETLLERTDSAKAVDRAYDREFRRFIRARRL